MPTTMLDTLRRTIQEVNSAPNLHRALEIIVARVKTTMAMDVCSVYLADQNANELVLMATDGLRPEAVGRIRLDVTEGLVGLVAERAEPVNIDNATEHPRYRYFPVSGEEEYSSFAGVPIIHHRQVLGVLVVQHRVDVRLDEDAISFLVTIAAQLAGAIAHADASGGIPGLHETEQLPLVCRPLQGLPGAPGVAIGTAVVLTPLTDIESVPDRRTTDPEGEIAAFRLALATVRNDIDQLSERLAGHLPPEDRALFDAYRMMLESDTLIDQTLLRIKAGNWAPGALRETLAEHIRVFDEMDDDYLRERGDDIRDLGRRILRCLQSGDRATRTYPNDSVLVGEEITASMLAEAPAGQVRGVVSVRGSRTSHVAILARALGIPAVMGAEDLPVGRVDEREVIVDGYSGRVYVNPNDVVRTEYQRLAKEEAEIAAELLGLADQPSVTRDGRPVPLFVNTGLVSDITPSRQSGAEGIGLYRTEFPFMVRDRFPGEAEQHAVYRQVLEAFHPRPVTLRTLDVGGDKALPYYPIREENPFLGWRGIRITLDHPELFLTQARAMLRADIGLNNLNVLLPMISGSAELDDATRLIRRAHDELREEGFDVRLPRIGAMIEVPSAVYQIDSLARRADFLSVGSNDLTQYLLAVDRNNPRVAELYDSLHPAVLKALQQIVKGSHAQGKPVSVCGEMAGDPAAAVLLIGMGVDALSMTVSSLLRVKSAVRRFSFPEARRLLDDVLTMENPAAVRVHLHAALDRVGLGGLIRAGK